MINASLGFFIFLDAGQLTHFIGPEILLLAFYFALVVFIGFYVKGPTNTSEEFFLAGREMSAWIAGLSFSSANLGSLELMGWVGSAYQYGMLATHWYWIGAIPAMLFLGIAIPFYYISKTHSVPGYMQLRFGEGELSLPEAAAGLFLSKPEPHRVERHTRSKNYGGMRTPACNPKRPPILV